MSQLELIEKATADLRDARNSLDERMQLLKNEIGVVHRKHLQGIMDAANDTSSAHDEVYALVSINADLFEKPRTKVLNGVRIGYAKGKGVINFTSKIISMIKKKMPDQFDVLVKTTEKPVAKALGNLSAAELKALGVTVTKTGDQIVIKHTVSTELDKLVEGFLKEAEQYRMQE